MCADQGIAQIEPVFAELARLTEQEPRAVLERMGERFLAAATSPDALAAGRMVIAQSTQSDIGQHFLEIRTKRMADLSAYLAATTKAGRLNVKDPPVAAQHLLGSRQRFTRSQIRLAACSPSSGARLQDMMASALRDAMQTHPSTIVGGIVQENPFFEEAG
jgi:AcrR family transcriptional regulator